MRPVPSARRALLAALAAILLVPAPASAAGPCARADAEPTASTRVEARYAVRCLLNRVRTQHGLRKIRGNPRLRRAATRHSRDMVRRGFFAHVTPGGRDIVARISRAGYLRPGIRYTVGENIGWGQQRLATPRSMVRAWMDSPGHRANILHRRFEHIGIGIVMGTPGDRRGVTYTTNFGTRS